VRCSTSGGGTSGGGRRDHRGVERGPLGKSLRAVAHYYGHPGNFGCFKVAASPLREIGEPLDGNHLLAQHGQDGTLEAETRPYLEDPFLALETEPGNHPGDQRGLGGDLTVTDRDGTVLVGTR
jgi:hypothetical protein